MSPSCKLWFAHNNRCPTAARNAARSRGL